MALGKDSSVAAQYVRELKSATTYLAAWLPNSRRQLGAVGVMDEDTVFIPRTSLSALGASFDTEKGAILETFQ